MSEPGTLCKAVLVELAADFKKPLAGGRTVTVQFNPESLKVTYANKIEQSAGAGDNTGNPPRQVVGAGSTKLALQIWFDANAPDSDDVRDVRTRTEQVAYFMRPKSATVAGGKQPVPPGVRFSWGTFGFDGMMDSLEETLDFFSPDGRPLRASLTIGMSGQLEIVPATGGAGKASTAGPTPGTSPLTQTTGGSSVQGLAASAGLSADWQAIADANGIDNPRALAAGQLLDLNLGSVNAGGFGISGGATVTGGFGT